MVGNKLLNIVNYHFFRALHVLLIGDLFQLQPIMDDWIFRDIRSGYGPLSTNIWVDYLANFCIFTKTDFK